MVKTEKSCAKKLLAGMKILLIVFGQNSLYSDSWARHNEKMKKQLAVPPPRSKGGVRAIQTRDLCNAAYGI